MTKQEEEIDILYDADICSIADDLCEAYANHRKALIEVEDLTYEAIKSNLFCIINNCGVGWTPAVKQSIIRNIIPKECRNTPYHFQLLIHHLKKTLS